MNPILFIGEDSFSTAVARSLAGICGAENVCLDSLSSASSADAAGRSVVFAFDCPAPLALDDAMSAIIAASRGVYAILSMESAYLQFGPIIRGRQAPCGQCWIHRRARSQRTEHAQAVDAHYSTPGAAYPKGWLSPFVPIAASIIASRMDLESDCALSSGSLWRMNWMTRNVTSSRVLGIHGCPACGARRAPQERSIAAMATALNGLWPLPGTPSKAKHEQVSH